MMMHKFVQVSAAMLCGVAMLFSLVGCGSQTTSNGPLTISFWVRSADEGFVQTVVNTYNTTHKNHVALTIIPN